MATRLQVAEQVAAEEEPYVGPQNASRSVSSGDDVTVTIPLVAALILMDPVGHTLAETSDAAKLLREQLP